jgi:hypothetical protein
MVGAAKRQSRLFRSVHRTVAGSTRPRPSGLPTNLSFISYLSTYLPSSATAIDPGTYCGGITVNSGAPFTMNVGRLHHDQ